MYETNPTPDETGVEAHQNAGLGVPTERRGRKPKFNEDQEIQIGSRPPTATAESTMGRRGGLAAVP